MTVRFFEPKHKPLLPQPEFFRRVLRHLLISLALIALALSIGIVGYMQLNHEAWDDALLDASMILGGMGPVSIMHSTGAKVFASMYALFAGLTFVSLTGLMLAPFMHRILHSFHLADE